MTASLYPLSRRLQFRLVELDQAGEEHGVWGGLTEDERRSLKRRATRGHIVGAA